MQILGGNTVNRNTHFCALLCAAALFAAAPAFGQDGAAPPANDRVETEAASDSAPARRGAVSDIRFPPPLDDPSTDGFELTPWLTIKPFMRIATWGTTNLFQQGNSSSTQFVGSAVVRQRGKQNDVVFAAMPGLDVIAKGDSGRLALGYSPRLLTFVKNGGLDTVEHYLRFDSALTIDKLTLKSSGAASWGISISDPQFTGAFHNFSGSGNASAEYQFTEVFGVLNEGRFNVFENFPRALKLSNVASWQYDSFLTISPNTDHDLKFLFGGGFREWHYIDESATRPDIGLGHVMAGVIYNVQDVVTVDARAGIEDGYVKKRRAFRTNAANGLDDGLGGLDGLIGRGSVTWTVFPEWTTISVNASHRVEATPEAAWRRTTAFGGVYTQHLPFSLEMQFAANWQVRQPRREGDIRIHNYTFNLSWFGVEHVEFGGQAGYTRVSSRRSSFETFHGGISLTFRL